MDKILDKEVVALKQFRGEIADLIASMTPYQSHDVSLLRFLRARDLNVEKAVIMIRQHRDWRIDNNIDNILQLKLPPELETMFPIKVCGFCKEGCPVVLAHSGIWDWLGAWEAGLREDFVLYVEQLFEQVNKFCEAYSTPQKILTQAYVIVDASGSTLRQLMSKETLQVIIQLIKILELNYPELLRLCFVINVPKICIVVWKAVKHLIAARTVSKINLLAGSNEWQPIFDLIDPDNWPSAYGGAITSCVDWKLSYGLDVFIKYDTLSEKDFHSIVIGAGSKESVPVTMPTGLGEGWKLSWNFRTLATGGDIGFGVEFSPKESPGEMRTLIKNARVNSHIHLQKGIISCDQGVGVYFLTFDNSYSTFRPKTVSYAVCRQGSSKTNLSPAIISLSSDNDNEQPGSNRLELVNACEPSYILVWNCMETIKNRQYKVGKIFCY